MESTAARGVQVALAMGGAYLIALWFVLAVWTFRDIEGRSKNVVTQITATLLSVLFFIPGAILYLILRPKETLDEAFQRSLEEEYLLQDLEELPVCGSCQRWVEDDFVVCPHCQSALKVACAACSRLVNMKWSLCPYCGADRSEQARIEIERVETPAARWVARAPRSFRVTRRPVEVPAAFAPTELVYSDYSNGVEETAALETAPIRLFDRKSTKSSRNGADAAHSNGASADTDQIDTGSAEEQSAANSSR